MALFVSLWIKLFFVLTPFFGLSMFLSFTEGYPEARRRKLALHVTAAVAFLCLLLFFAGQQIFNLFGITLDSFRIGAGVLLLLSAIGLVQGGAQSKGGKEGGDIAVVPLAVPIIVGPATTGTLLVLGAELTVVWHKVIGCLALLTAVICIGAVLLASSAINRCVGDRGITILSKLTGLVLAALAAQMIMTGLHSFLVVHP